MNNMKYLGKKNDNNNENKNKRKMSYDSDDSWHPDSDMSSSDSEYDSDNEINNQIQYNTDDNLDNNENINDTYHKITKNVLEKIYNDVCNQKKIKNINKYLDNLLKEINLAENEMFDSDEKVESLNRVSIELSNNIIRKVVSDIRSQNNSKDDFNIKNYLKNKIDLHEEMSDLLSDHVNYNTRNNNLNHISKKFKLDDTNNLVVNVQLDPLMAWKRSAFENLKKYSNGEYDDEYEYDDDEYNLDDFIEEDEDISNSKKSECDTDIKKEFRDLINNKKNTK